VQVRSRSWPVSGKSPCHKTSRLIQEQARFHVELEPALGVFVDALSPLTANKAWKFYAAVTKGFASSFWHFAMTFAADFEVHLNG
jgi:hypothetical protein